MSRRRLVFLVALVIGSLAVTSLALAGGGNGKGNGKGLDKHSTWSAKLSGYNETPSLNSKGHGTLTLTIGSGSLSFKLDYADLSGNPAVAHVHVGQVGVAGGVSFFFCGGGGKPACPAAPSGSISGTVAPADVVGPTAQGFDPGDLNSLIAAIENGVTYANVHTAKFPAGEIRGQLVHGHRFGHS